MIIPQWLFQKTKAFTIHLPFSPSNGSFVKTLTISFHFISVSHTEKKLNPTNSFFDFVLAAREELDNPTSPPFKKNFFQLYHSLESVQIWSFFVTLIFPHSDWIRRNTLHMYSPYSARMRENTDQERLRIWTLFTQSIFCEIIMNLPHFLTNTLKSGSHLPKKNYFCCNESSL